MNYFHKTFYSHYSDESNKVGVVYFTIRELSDDEREPGLSTGILLEGIIKKHGDSRNKVYVFVKRDDTWQISVRNPDGTLMAIGASERYFQWLIQVVDFEYTNGKDTMVEGTESGFYP